uniref:Putative secreted protein n=1 Tax=Ixodes ricinus TaxID=34613 RepID=A0A6B0ULR2_IXORI
MGNRMRDRFAECVLLYASMILAWFFRMVQSVEIGTWCFSASFVFEHVDLFASSMRQIFCFKVKDLYLGIFGLCTSQRPNHSTAATRTTMTDTDPIMNSTSDHELHVSRVQLGLPKIC